jgi:hypothetical protein
MRVALCGLLAGQCLLAGCAGGDFGRPRAWLVSDEIHDWVGAEAARADGLRTSQFPLTDEERRLRDLAYPLIEPPYDRDRWFSVLDQYGLTKAFRPDAPFDRTAYSRHLMDTAYRSANARYAKLNEDIRNDVERIGPFFAVARRVLDLDTKRTQSLAYVSKLTRHERADADARNAENALTVAWVQCSLAERSASYRYALERLVISTPSPVAADVEHALTLFDVRIADNRLVAEPAICPGIAAPLAAAGPQTVVSK